MIKTRTAKISEVEQLLLWAKREGWNPGLDDASAFYAADPSGFFVACDKGIAVAGVSMVKQDQQNAFLGLYICLPEFRGRGFGLAAWNRGLRYARSLSIGLDSVLEQQSNYQQSGFVYQHRTTRFSGTLPQTLSIRSPYIRSVQIADIPAVIRMDAQISGVMRSSFYQSWLADTPTRVSFVHEENNQLTGLITLRRCVDGFKIGPLLADSPSVARQLVDHVGVVSKNENVLIDVPEPNVGGTEMVKNMKFQPVFETARMYRGAVPVPVLEKTFGVATLELG